MWCQWLASYSSLNTRFTEYLLHCFRLLNIEQLDLCLEISDGLGDAHSSTGNCGNSLPPALYNALLFASVSSDYRTLW